MAPSTFASAAAAGNPPQNQTRDTPSEWSRRTNGATQTFRRPSGATANPSAGQQPEPLASHAPRYVPPHRNGTIPDSPARYSKDQLLDLFRAQASQDRGLHDTLPHLYIAGWQPEATNGASAGWGRSDYSRENQPGPELCWERDGASEPLSLIEMDQEERELFATSVNTPIKLPAAGKENQHANGLPGRKVSISSATTPGGFGLPSPSVARGTGRRRDTSESYPFPQNNLPSSGTHDREEQRTASPPPSLLRRRTDLKDPSKADDRDGEDRSTASPFGSLRRNPTGPLSAGFTAPSSPWSTGPQSAGVPPMGAFGSFGLSGTAVSQGTSTDKRSGPNGGRAESRFRNVLHKESSEDNGHRALERQTSISGLSRVVENESWRAQERLGTPHGPPDEAEENLPTGSAALAADTDISPPHPRQAFRGFGTPSRHTTQDEYGFGAFGMTSDHSHGYGQAFLQGRDDYQQTPAPNRPGQPGGSNEPMSPTDTNPYQSPENHSVERVAEGTGDEGHDQSGTRLPGLGQSGGDLAQQLGGLGSIGALPNFGRTVGAHGAASDRSQTSSVGPSRAFPGLGGLGQLGNAPGSAAWTNSQGAIGTPSRQSAGLANPFGGGVFANAMPDIQSSNLAGLGGGSILSPQIGAYGGSRMASMFPQAMQDQMRHSENERDPNIDRMGQAFSGLGEVGRGAESPFANQGFNHGQDIQPHQEAGESLAGQFGAPGQQLQQHIPQGEQPVQIPPQAPGSSASNQPPAPQQRTMVMPDRMRWIYRDPQGQTQGPWTGLEMHDWYKAGFFSPELLVKKFEDPDYEPLAQLIRRIGNSREPFLVPQIGIPHGAPSSTGPPAWTGSGSIPTTTGGTQPPFASSFPSFGTTLTAEQQNALERRKQEEQYLMARQKEHLAQAQIAQRMQMQGGHSGLMPSQLNHHSSAHSLQSQPSFGSIASPNAYQPSPVQGPSAGVSQPPSQGFLDHSFRSTQPSGSLGPVGAGADALGRIREEELPGLMDRLNPSGTRADPGQFGAPGQPYTSEHQTKQPGQDTHDRQVQQMLRDRARLQQEQDEYDAQQGSVEDQEALPNERLQQFRELRGEQDRFHPDVPFSTEDTTSTTQSLTGSPPMLARKPYLQSQEPLSLTEQVQIATSTKQSPAPQQPGFPQPFPPVPSQSPLPAPSAQRAGRQSVADQLQTDSRDESQTPSLETPSAAIAPWAKEPVEALKGPSLKEIQEAEAKKAAEAGELAAAARRAAFQKEMEAQVHAAAAQPGLPTSSIWAAGSPPTPTGSAPAAWAKPTQKPSGPTSSKTLAQIQKEEEARKRKLAAAAASAAQQQGGTMGAVSAPAGGKSYANLAGKIIAPPGALATGGAWTTVGAGGKNKTPTTPAVARSVSTGIVPTVQAPALTRKPTARSPAATSAGGINPQDEFKKWAVGELRPDLNKGINAEEFVAGLVQFPPEADIITEAVHGVSSTIDSRHFAEEFIRRKRLADKGIIDTTVKSASPLNAGGWSQVAKKGPTKEEPKEEAANGNFRVVPSKKKGGKR